MEFIREAAEFRDEVVGLIGGGSICVEVWQCGNFAFAFLFDLLIVLIFGGVLGW